MKWSILPLALLLGSCSPQGPHVEFVCTASHAELGYIPMTLPDGNGGVMMYMMPTTLEVCDAGYRVCMENNEQVEAAKCLK